MFVKLDKEVIDILCCPLCKSSVELQSNDFLCRNCATLYPQRTISQRNVKENVFDFRIYRPRYCVPHGWVRWYDMQKIYEDVHNDCSSVDNLRVYLREIDSVKQIYTEQFQIEGRVLDIGGHQGRLRHFLTKAVSMYVSIDPYLDVFGNIDSQENLLKAYPCISKPCNFLAGYAENLPFVERSFDWVHMRSVLDHFSDPFLAMKEAYRVLKPDGSLLIGLHIDTKLSSLNSNDSSGLGSWLFKLSSRVDAKFQREGLKGLKRAAVARIRTLGRKPDDHTWHWNYEDFAHLLSKTGFVIVKEHWQNSGPSDPMCIYTSVKKSEPF